jgi:NADPH-dependent 2,4-dienoyl-CoA reductase/sulfur reductase-like enzyme
MQTQSAQTFIVIGAGQAGGRAVEAMRQTGFAGRIVLVGAEPHLPYERPPLSKELLAADAGELQSMFERAWFNERDIDLHLGVAAIAIERDEKQVRLADGTAMPYDKLLLTTGAAVRELDIEGAALPGVHTLRTIEDNRAIEALFSAQKPVVVVGGGFIGLEVAAAAQLRGCAVTVLEFADRLMGRALPAQISAIFAALHGANGVDVRLDTGVARIEGTQRAEAVVTTAGDRIAVQGVIVGVGIAPQTNLAQAAGLSVENGIVVDEYCRSSDENIYAAGDAASQWQPQLGRHLRLESWQNAQNQAIAAARNMCGADTAFAEVAWFWSDQFDVNLQMCGAPLDWKETVTRGDMAARDGILFQLKEGRIVGAIGLNRPRDMRFVKRIMAAGKTPSPAQLADDAIGFRDLLRA